MKMRTLLVAAVMFLGLTAAAFAQATFSVGSVPVTTVTATGMTEKAGTITFSHLSGTTVAGTITINYQTAIANPTSAFTDVSVGGTIGATLNAAASNHGAGVLVINVPADATSGTISVGGVRVRISDTGYSNLQALISTTGNAIVAGQSVVTVINATRAGVGTVASPQPATINNVTNTVTITPVNTTTPVTSTSAIAILTVNEGYLDTWDGARYGTAANQGFVGIRLTFASAPQGTMRLVFPESISVVDANATGTATGGVFTRANSAGTTTTGTQRITSASSGSSLQVYYMANLTDPQKLEQVRIPVTIESSTSTAVSFAVPATPINVTVSMAPINTALLDDNGYGRTALPTSGGVPFPRYSASESAAVTLVNYEVANTTLLIPFATRILLTGFDTGISVANTTKDPGSAAMGVATAVGQSGRMTFYIYPQRQSDGTLPTPVVFTPTTAIANTTGLDASGNVPSGSTFTGMLSTIFTAAGVTASWKDNFNGYIFIVTEFTNAHGQYVLSDFKSFSQGALALVITSGRNASREALDN